MIAACSHCGKKYKIDLSKMNTDSAQMRCSGCQKTFLVTKPTQPKRAAQSIPTAVSADRTAVSSPSSGDKTRKGYFSLRTKMMLLFCFIPIMILFASGILYLRQLNNLAGLLSRDSSNIVKQLAENIVKERARAVSSQTQAVLQRHANILPNNYDRNDDFIRTVVQKVGLTGYTALYENPGNDASLSILIHPNDAYNGKSLREVMKKSLGNEFDRFDNIIQKVRKGGQVESAGYFLQQDRGKRAQEKYMVMSPIPGTTYGILAVTHLDEFTREISRLSKRANKITLATRNIVFIILGATLLLIFVVVMAYGQSLSGRIQSLTDLAEQISIGNLDTQIEVKTKDEIGILADAISRMQESIRLSMERLRRRR